jgi:hypothetical protein
VLYVPSANVSFSGIALDAQKITVKIGTSTISIAPPQQQSNVPEFNIAWTDVPGVQSNGTAYPCTTSTQTPPDWDIGNAETSGNSDTIFTCPVELGDGGFGNAADVTFQDGLSGHGSVWSNKIFISGAVALVDASLLSAAETISFTN